MKQSFLLSTIFYILFSVQGHTEGFASNSKSIADSDIINHVLDGSVSEWPENKFEIDKGTNIKYSTVSEIVTAYTELLNQNPNDGSLDAFNFRQIFYSHYNYIPSGNKSDMITLNDHIQNMNILNHLQELSSNPANGK